MKKENQKYYDEEAKLISGMDQGREKSWENEGRRKQSGIQKREQKG
jgi:hypothetical protein